MKTKPLPAMTASQTSTATPLEISFSCSESKNNPEGAELGEIEQLCTQFLEFIKASGNWQVQIKSNRAARAQKSLQVGQLKVVAPVPTNHRMAKIVLHTKSGDGPRECLLTGTLTAEQILDAVRNLVNRTFDSKPLETSKAGAVEPREKQVAGVVVPGPGWEPTKDATDTLISVLFTDGPDVLKTTALEAAELDGGQALLDHCVSEGLIMENGAAYSITEKGRGVIEDLEQALAKAKPAQSTVAETPTVPSPSLTIEGIMSEVEGARKILSERTELAGKLEGLKRAITQEETDRETLERRAEELRKQAETVHQQAEAKRNAILQKETQRRELEAQISSSRFVEAQATLGRLKQLLNTLGSI